MLLKINNKEYDIPFDASIIKLGDYIKYQEKYGNALDKELAEIIDKLLKKDTEPEKFNTIIDNHIDKEALSWFSFWTGEDFFEIQHYTGILQVLAYYRTLRVLFKHTEEEATKAFPTVVSWRGENWYIQDFAINPATEMTFNEIASSKEVMLQTQKQLMGKWESLPYLCAIFFRKENEQFIDQFIWEGSERLKMMYDLPLEHALKVDFFLRVCHDTYKALLVYSQIRADANQLVMN